MPQEPKRNAATIFEVMNPATGKYSVHVRVEASIAERYPDKPWGTLIEDVKFISSHESKRFAGYELVSITPADSAGNDHTWIFEDLNGPEWKTTTNSSDNLTPAKYRGQTVVVKTTQEVSPDTLPRDNPKLLEDGETLNPAYDPNLVSSSVQQIPNTGKALLTEITETIDVNAAPLVGQQFAPGGALLTTSENIVLDGVGADKGVNIAQSSVNPLGNGKSVKDTSTAKRRVATGGSDPGTSEDGWPTKQQKSKGLPSVIPTKFKGSVVTVVTKTQEPLTHTQSQDIPAPTAPSGDQVLIEHEKVNDYRYEKSITTEVIDENADPLLGKQAYEQRQVVNTSEQLVVDGTLSDSGPLIVSSSVNSLGNGKSVKQTVSVEAWDVHTEKTWDSELQAHVTHTEQFVGVSALTGTPANTDLKIVNKDRLLKITKTTPVAALDNFVISYPVKIRLDLPRVLKSVAVVWNEGKDIGQRFNDGGGYAQGTSISLSADNSDSDKSSASLMPEILTEFEDYSSDSLFATAYAFYLPMSPPITQARILAKLQTLTAATVSKWPVFKTKSHTIVGLGQSASVSVSTNASNNYAWNDQTGVTKATWQQGYGDDISKNLSNSAAQIAPCIHGTINISGQTSRTLAVSATASSPIYSQHMRALTPRHTRSMVVVASVSPVTLPATSPASIPTSGLYLTDSKVQPADYNYAKIYTEVFNAADLA